MSTSLLYHGFGIVGYQYVNQIFQEGQEPGESICGRPVSGGAWLLDCCYSSRLT